MKILVASSGSFDESVDSAHTAFSFPWPASSQFHVVSVAETIYPVMVGMVPDPVDTTDVQIVTDEEARSTASRVAGRFRSLGFEAEGFSVKGDPETEIVDHAKQWGADLIVVGSHDLSRLERLLVGSVAESVVKHAPCSVLVLKH